MPEYKSDFWDERFSVKEFIYGKEPNQFFKEQLDKITSPGKLLLPGEGEGRNAVYAATRGWFVDAFDQSTVARLKAEKLAKEKNITINYFTIDLDKFTPIKNKYDCAALIFIHLSPQVRTTFHKKVIDAIKPGGKIILELFSKNQFGKTSGGPQDLEMLSSVEEIKNDYNQLKTILVKEVNIDLAEGEKHSGEASVIRYVGEKTL